MQPPISVGTVLQNRYRLIQILGQGGFGRTYLAEDQRRFNELCAIKELIPNTTDPGAWQKAQELFLREAAILYQIKHPQVPQFRERFEQDQRLFLVQDYVAGKTYRELLEERKASKQAFTEEEVLQLLRSLLPVLEHIHARGIIHRDISPDNIILRSLDNKPVLIDFGVVKELATRLQSPNLTASTTYVGKLGYSPSEQMQTGQAYPSSDLYALAVTAIVLLTGKEPQELFDENQLTWNWQRWVTVNPQLARVLNRMLSYRPGDRYQSAAEVLEALSSVEQPSPAPQVPLSDIQTVPIARRPHQVPLSAPSSKQQPVIPEPTTRSVLDNPWAMGTITLVVAIVAGFGSWVVVRSLHNSPPEPPPTSPQTFPSPVVTGGTTASPSTPPLVETPSPSVPPTPTVKVKFLDFSKSNTVKVDGTIKANEIIRYNFKGQKNQQLTVLLAQESGVLLSVLGDNQRPIEDAAKAVTFYQGILPVTGTYTIELTLAEGITESDYSLNAKLENSIAPIPIPTPTTTPTQTPTATPTEIPTPTPSQTSSPLPTTLPSPTQTPLQTPIPSPATPTFTATPFISPSVPKQDGTSSPF